MGAQFSALSISEPVKSSEPRIAWQQKVLIWTFTAGDGSQHRLRCLADTGAEIDLINASLACSLDIPIKKLLAPLHLKLGTTGKDDRLPFYANVDFSSGSLKFEDRGFFVGNVQGYDAILGLPFIEDAQIMIGSGKVSCIRPPGSWVSSLVELSP